MERCVDIPVSKDLRDKIKTLKREKTYEEFLDDLLKKGVYLEMRQTDQHSRVKRVNLE